MWKWDFCNVIIPSEDTKTLEFNQYQKSDKASFIIYADLEYLIHKKILTTRVSKHNPSGFSMSTISSFKIIQNKHDVYTGKDCMKKFLREHAMNISTFKKNKKLNYEQKSSMNHLKMQKSVIFVMLYL